jgi:hypothetical protein
MAKWTNDQKVIRFLAETKLLTQVGEITAALADPEYATELLNFDIPEDDEIGGDCEHEALSFDEIQEVFDNDNE